MADGKKGNGFTSGIGFILAAAGSAVGLGNLWAFPYKTSVNGGAAFVIIYIVSVLLIGIITMIAEVYIGRRAEANPVTAYSKMNKNLGFLGLFGVIVPFLIACYYSVLGGYTIRFAFNSFGTNAGTVAAFAGDKGMVILCVAAFIMLALIVVICGVQKGIESASKILMPTLFFILIGIVIYCLCLGEGVKEGVEYYLKPDFSKVTAKTFLAAMSQAFYSMSLGMGIMVSYGSYSGKKINLFKSTLAICLFDTIVALLAGLAIFPAIYHYEALYPDQNLSASGLMLMFNSLPYVFADMGLAGKFLSFFFFAMVVIAALTSVISLYEVVTQFVIQKFKASRKIAITVVAVISFIISIPISISLGYELNGISEMTLFGKNLLDFFDIMTNTVFMPICALGSCIGLGWCTGLYESKKDRCNFIKLNKILNEDGLKLGKFGPFFSFMLKYITPTLIAIIEVFGVIDTIWVNGKFDLDGLLLILVSYIVIAIAIVVYFTCLKGKHNGTNEDEISPMLKFAEEEYLREEKING